MKKILICFIGLLLMTSCSGIITNQRHLSSKLDNPSVSRGFPSPTQIQRTIVEHENTRLTEVVEETKTCAKNVVYPLFTIL